MEALEFKEIKRLLNVCYQCGTCVSSCAAGLVNPQKNIRKLIQNLIDTTDESELKENDLLWLCTSCYQCEDRCPEGVPLTTLLIRLKNMAVERGVIPDFVQKEIETIVTHSFTYPPAKSIIARRKRLGLPDLPRPAEAEMQTLFNLVWQDITIRI
ncbi:MAG: 4Fe-4S dicluster domain-containing protein [bacterium]|nr:4Fe-4S dicluster domain-containing protein [bacterium]